MTLHPAGGSAVLTPPYRTRRVRRPVEFGPAFNVCALLTGVALPAVVLVVAFAIKLNT